MLRGQHGAAMAFLEMHVSRGGEVRSQLEEWPVFGAQSSTQQASLSAEPSAQDTLTVQLDSSAGGVSPSLKCLGPDSLYNLGFS